MPVDRFMASDEVMARVEIYALISLYNTAGDSGRRDEFLAVFSDDAVLEAPGILLVGSESIVEGLFSGEARAKFVRHHLSTSTITMTDDSTANGRTYFQVMTEIGLDHIGIYTDRFCRVGDDWKISHRIVSIDFVSENSRFFPDGLPARF